MTGERDDLYDTTRILFGSVLKASRDAFGALQISLAPDTGGKIRQRIIEGFLVPWAGRLPHAVEIDLVDGGMLSLDTRSGSLSIKTNDVDGRALGDSAWYDHAHQIVSRLVVIATSPQKYKPV